MSVLVVPVPEVDQVVGGWRERLDPSSAQGMPAHVTALYPFLPRRLIDADLQRDLALVAGATSPFGFRLERLGRFPGVVYLAPEPAEPFVSLTRALVRRWPSCVPYDGAYPDVVPHVTIAVGEEPPALAGALQSVLPIEAKADHLLLMVEEDDGRWSTRATLPLGTADLDREPWPGTGR